MYMFRISHSGGGAPPILQFFLKPPPSKSISPIGRTPHLNIKASHLKNNPPPLKREAPFHEMIPRKSTINSNLKSSWNSWKICVKKFIFSKFAGLRAYSHQLYYQMNSFTGFFDSILSPPPMLPQCIDLSTPPPPPLVKFWRAPPHVLNTCGKPCTL